MPFSVPARALLLSALILVSLQPLRAQIDIPAGPYTVAGTVVSGYDSHPLQHATVDLLSTDGKSLRTTTSDELGQFRFSNIAKGLFVLRGEAPGFLQTRLQQHALFSSAVVTGSSVPSESLILALHPLGQLSGTITDESAEPVRNAQVHLYRQTPAGHTRFTSAGQTQTNDLGQYQFARLPPGAYFLAVIAAPWYAVHPVGNDIPEGAIGIVPYRDPALDVAYPVTYYSAGSDPDRATPIEIQGNQARADLQLTPVPALTLTAPHVQTDSSRNPTPQFQPTIFGQPAFAPFTSAQSGDTWVVGGLAPGDYEYRTNSAIRNPDGSIRTQFSGTTRIHLAANTSNTLPAEDSSPSAHLRLTLRSADGESLPPDIQLQLLQTGRPTDPELRRSASSHQVELDLSPGDYYLALGNAPGLFVRDLTLAGKPLPSNDLHLSPRDSLTGVVTLARGNHALRGFVHSAPLAPSGAMLLLIPADQHLPPRTFFRDESNLDGSFEIPQLPPGPYLLLALPESAWDTNWLDPGFLSRHLPLATPVLIREKSSTQIDLPEPINIQPL